MCKLNLIFRARTIEKANICWRFRDSPWGFRVWWIFFIVLCCPISLSLCPAWHFQWTWWWSSAVANTRYQKKKLTCDKEISCLIAQHARRTRSLKYYICLLMLHFMTRSTNIAHEKRLLQMRTESDFVFCGSAFDDGNDDDTTHSERQTDNW